MEAINNDKKIDTVKKLKLYIDENLYRTNKFVILPHVGIDYDALASAIGLSLIARKLKKLSCIVIDESIYEIDHMLQNIIEEEKDNYLIINSEMYLKNADLQNNMYILTDVNSASRTSLKDEVMKSDNVVIIDHHDESEKTVKTCCKWINSKMSSASEMIVKLLRLYKVKISSEVAQYLLAGIYLDTNHFTKNVEADTMDVVTKLLERGASMNKVTDLFVEDFNSDMRIQRLVSKSKFDTYTIATTLASDGFYTKEELAKAADYLLKYKVDASFVIGRFNEKEIGISARSKANINVGDVMRELGGGGNPYSAATQINSSSVENIEKQLKKIIRPSCYTNNN